MLTRAIGWPQFALLAPLALAKQLQLPAIVNRGCMVAASMRK